MKDFALLTGIVVFLTTLLHCGTSRIAIGGGCSSLASTTECVDGAICAGSGVCSKVCTSDSDCTAPHTCQAVSGSGLKACQ